MFVAYMPLDWKWSLYHSSLFRRIVDLPKWSSLIHSLPVSTCSSSPQKVEFKFLPLISGQGLMTYLANKIQPEVTFGDFQGSVITNLVVSAWVSCNISLEMLPLRIQLCFCEKTKIPGDNVKTFWLIAPAELLANSQPCEWALLGHS